MSKKKSQRAGQVPKIKFHKEQNNILNGDVGANIIQGESYFDVL